MSLVYSLGMKILGIDPGTGRIGWAVIEKDKGKEELVKYGCFETKANSPLPERLELIFQEMFRLVDEFKPDEAAVEELFFATNAKTVMSVGQARGVVILALKMKGVAIYNYTPLQIKMAVTGYGKADKKQVQEMVRRILKLEMIPKPDDAADAVAVALSHSAAVKQITPSPLRVSPPNLEGDNKV